MSLRPELRVLEEILAHKRQEVEERQRRLPLAEITGGLEKAPTPRPFAPPVKPFLIAEVKRRSPSHGTLDEDIDPVARALAYVDGGAAAISVLTDTRDFGGSFADLSAIREAVSVPVLCKDFILTEYQVYEARHAGADLLLLIVRALPDAELGALHALTLELGMLPLVEVHDQHDMARGIMVDPSLIGINNRDLDDLSVNLVASEYLAPLAPDECTLVSESGISSREDVERVVQVGADGVLVGEALLRAPDPRRAIAELLP